VAVDRIKLVLGDKKWRREIILVTDGESETDWEGTESVKEQMEKNDIELAVAGVDFDDSKLGFKEEDKPAVKVRIVIFSMLNYKQSSLTVPGLCRP
jgi:hypothetical protein